MKVVLYVSLVVTKDLVHCQKRNEFEMLQANLFLEVPARLEEFFAVSFCTQDDVIDLVDTNALLLFLEVVIIVSHFLLMGAAINCHKLVDVLQMQWSRIETIWKRTKRQKSVDRCRP